MEEEVQQFLDYCEHTKGFAERSIEKYRQILFAFAGTLQMPIEELTLEDIHTFIKIQKEKRGRKEEKLHSNTIRNYLIAIRSFLKYCAIRRINTCDYRLISTPKKRTKRYCLTKKEMKDLRQAVLSYAVNQSSYPKFCVGYRDRAIVELLYSTGMRVSELLSLDIDDVLLGDSIRVYGKGREYRYVFLSKEARHWIDYYLQIRNDAHPALLVTHEVHNGKILQGDGRITKKGVLRRLLGYGRQAKIPKRVTPHILRHTFATHMLNNGANLRIVQEMLGHKSIETTQLYTHLQKEDLQRAHDKFMM